MNLRALRNQSAQMRPKLAHMTCHRNLYFCDDWYLHMHIVRPIRAPNVAKTISFYYAILLDMQQACDDACRAGIWHMSVILIHSLKDIAYVHII